MSKQRRESTIKLRDRRSKEKHLEPVIEQESPLAFAVISKKESKQLLDLTPNEIESLLEKKFQLNSETELKDSAILDYYVGAVHWCQQQGFNSHQLSIFFTIVHKLLKKIDEEHASLVCLITEFHNLVFGHDDSSKPVCDTVFSNQQTKAITDYVSSGLFNHYNLYLYMMSRPQEIEIITDELPTEQPPTDQPPLDEGLPDEILSRFFSSLETQQMTLVVSEEALVEPEENIGIELPSNAVDIFGKLTLEDVQKVISEAYTTVMDNLQADTKNKLEKEEFFSLAKISKIHVVHS